MQSYVHPKLSVGGKTKEELLKHGSATLDHTMAHHSNYIRPLLTELLHLNVQTP